MEIALLYISRIATLLGLKNIFSEEGERNLQSYLLPATSFAAGRIVAVCHCESSPEPAQNIN
jgi:hypothetical protein